MLVMAWAMYRKCSKNRMAKVWYTGSCRPSSSAIESIVRQNRAIQLVPSLCSSWPPPGSGLSRSKHSMLSMPRNPPPNTSRPLASFRLTQKLKQSDLALEHRPEELEVARAPAVPLDPVHLPGRPAEQRRVHVVEVPLVGGELPADVLVAGVAHQQQLRLGELRVDVGHGHAVKGEVPRGVPRILPGVRHQDHVGVAQRLPLPVPAVPALVRAAAAAADRRGASGRRRSDRTAWTRAARRRPGAGAAARRRRAWPGPAPRRRRRPRRGGGP